MSDYADAYRKGFQEKCAQRQWDIGPLSVSWGKPPPFIPPPPTRTLDDVVARGIGSTVGGLGGAAVGGATGAIGHGAGGMLGGGVAGYYAARLASALKGGKAGALKKLLYTVLGTGLGGVGGVVHGGVKGMINGARLHTPVGNAAESVVHGINEFGFNHGIGTPKRRYF